MEKKIRQQQNNSTQYHPSIHPFSLFVLFSKCYVYICVLSVSGESLPSPLIPRTLIHIYNTTQEKASWNNKKECAENSLTAFNVWKCGNFSQIKLYFLFIPCAFMLYTQDSVWDEKYKKNENLCCSFFFHFLWGGFCWWIFISDP